jgi:hypothetical protein
MKGRIGQLWRLRRGAGDAGSSVSETARQSGDAARAADGAAPQDGLVLPGPDRPSTLPPEQPVLLTPTGGTRQVHVGELLPARRPRWPLSVVRLPVIPKRAILAAGVCAGLAAPTLARHLATRIILGRPTSGVHGVLEVTRIVYTGPLTPRAATAIGKILEAGRH